jgi:hypothetical protein
MTLVPSLRRCSILIAGVAALVLATPAVMAAPSHSHGGGEVIAVLNANQSTNWGGYNQGTLEQGTTLFSQVSGDWTVPTATQHTSGRAEYSATWLGIGGGCVDTNCAVIDNTLIQAGTSQDIDSAGRATYYAWYELIPAPSLTVTTLAVRAGDGIHVDIREVATGTNVWTITINNRTTGQSFTMTVPYSSTKGSAEWIVETPLVFGTGGAGVSAMPNLSTVLFDNAMRNGALAQLKSSEEIQLVARSQIIATPSSPDPDADGFNLCTYAGSCGAPASS